MVGKRPAGDDGNRGRSFSRVTRISTERTTPLALGRRRAKQGASKRKDHMQQETLGPNPNTKENP